MVIRHSQLFSANDLCVSIKQLVTLSQIAGTNDKQIYLTEVLKNELTQELIRVLLDNTIVLGLKKIQPIGVYKEVNEVTGSGLLRLIEVLSRHNINDVLREEVSKLLSCMSKEVQEVTQGILCKTFKIGVTAKTVNKVKKGLISEFSCMLADSGECTKYPVAVGLKYDGVRCVAFVSTSKVTLFTRQGNTIQLPHIEKELLKLANGTELVFDGELISTTRTAISGTINSIMKTGYTISKGIDVHYKVFDTLPYNVFLEKSKSATLKDRLIDLGLRFFDKDYKYISEAVHTIAETPEDVVKIYNYYIQQGEEGVILKDLDAEYYFKRSKAWLKEKAINNCTLKVVSTTEGTNARKGKIGALVCQSECGKLLVNVGSGLTDDDLDTMTPEGIIGNYIDVTFNVVIKGEDASTYSLFLPRLCKGWLRVDKDKADTVEKIIKEHNGTPLI